MAAADHRARALSFGAIAEDYDRFRPGPPVAAVEWMLPRRCDAAVDIGAGTGALTRLLVEKVGRVVAVEPDRRMAGVLTSRVPGAGVVVGRAEQLPLGAGSVDAVVGSSMWHWVDEERAASEAARVLRPGGVLGLLWSGPDRAQPWVAELLGRSALEVGAPDERPARHHHEVHLPADAPFSEPVSHTVPWSLAVTAKYLVELACTYSRFIVLPEPDKARLREGLTDLAAGHPALAGGEEIDLPMRCICWRAVRDA
jgi:SAM-dependent methyltransferase